MLKFNQVKLNKFWRICVLTHTHHSMYNHQPHSNTTKVVLGSASDNINYVMLKFKQVKF